MKEYPFLDLALANAPYMDDLKSAACEVIERGRYLPNRALRVGQQRIGCIETHPEGIYGIGAPAPGR